MLTRVYRDGQPVLSNEQPVNVRPSGADLKRIPILTRIKPGAPLAPGEYVLQIVITDTLRNDKHRVAAQWIDFEVVK
jgi:hypothetical protein